MNGCMFVYKIEIVECDIHVFMPCILNKCVYDGVNNLSVCLWSEKSQTIYFICKRHLTRTEWKTKSKLHLTGQRYRLLGKIDYHRTLNNNNNNSNRKL